MAPAASVVRKATRADLPELSRVLARAFDDDPVIKWMFPKDARRPVPARRFFGIRARQLLTREEVYTTDDVAGGAIWAPPEHWHMSLREVSELGPIMPALGLRLPRSLRELSRMERRHPTTPHYYLAVLGTDPSRWGEGIGSALMAPVLQGCDADGIGAYLESSKERNVGYYARHGFRVTEEVQLPKGPPVWLMWRDPR